MPLLGITEQRIADEIGSAATGREPSDRAVHIPRWRPGHRARRTAIARIKLDCVPSDLLGKSGRAMLAALIAGTTDPNVHGARAWSNRNVRVVAAEELAGTGWG